MTEPPAKPFEDAPRLAPPARFLVDGAIAVMSVYAYVFFEWLFFITKPSFTASLDAAQVASLLLVTPLPAAAAALAAQAACEIVFEFWGKKREHGELLLALPAAAALGSLALILLDNFTYTLFSFGIVGTTGLKRLPYAGLLPLLFFGAGLFFLRFRALHGRPIVRLAGIVVAMSILVLPLHFIERSSPLSRIPDLARAPRPKNLPNILFVASDGVIAEDMSAYGYERDTTPYLERFSEKTLLFENAFSNVGRTYGSVISMFTGKLPTETKTAFPPNILTGRDSFEHLPLLLRQLGYRNVQVSMRYYSDAADANMALAFEESNYRHVTDELTWAVLKLRAPSLLPHAYFGTLMYERIRDRIFHILGIRPMENPFTFVSHKAPSLYFADEFRLSEALRLLGETSQPWFFHVHFMDTHCCGAFGLPHANAPSGASQLLRNWYDRQIRRSDQYMEVLLNEVERLGLLDNTLVVISSDHTIGWDTRARVPLMIRFPGEKIRGRVKENVQLADLPPTILEYLGIAAPEWMSGRSLLHPVDPLRPIFSINQIEMRKHEKNPFLKQLADPGPPNYGASTFAMVVCNRWYDLNLKTREMKSGEVNGHRAPCDDARLPSEAEARRMMEDHLRANGFGGV